MPVQIASGRSGRGFSLDLAVPSSFAASRLHIGLKFLYIEALAIAVAARRAKNCIQESLIASLGRHNEAFLSISVTRTLQYRLQHASLCDANSFAPSRPFYQFRKPPLGFGDRNLIEFRLFWVVHFQRRFASSLHDRTSVARTQQDLCQKPCMGAPAASATIAPC